LNLQATKNFVYYKNKEKVSFEDCKIKEILWGFLIDVYIFYFKENCNVLQMILMEILI